VSLGVKRKEKNKNHNKFIIIIIVIIIIIIIIINTNRDHWLDTSVQKNCLQKDAAGIKLFAHTTTQKKIVCLETVFIPPPLPKK